MFSLLADLNISTSNQQEVIVGWGTLAMIVAGIAQGKNRSGLGWFLGSLIFGPVALFILLLHENIKSEEDPKKDTEK